MLASSSLASISLSAATALCLATTLLALARQDLAPGGTPVLLPRVCTPYQAANKGDGREVWVKLLPHGESYINNMPFSLSSIPSEIATAMATRQERLVYLTASADLTYGEVSSTTAALHNAYPENNIALVTSSQLKAAEPLPCIWLTSTLLRSSP